MTAIGLASDHAAFPLKQFVKKYLEEKGIEQNEVERGIAMCGSGEGISMTLNKHQSIRAGLVWRPEIAHLIREHNNANVIVFPGRFIDEATCRACLDEFFNTEFAGGRHLDRIQAIPVQ